MSGANLVFPIFYGGLAYCWRTSRAFVPCPFPSTTKPELLLATLTTGIPSVDVSQKAIPVAAERSLSDLCSVCFAQRINID